MATALREVGPYQKAARDIHSYELLLDDIEGSLQEDGEVRVFDLGMLFTVARNTAMVLSFLGGRPAFGRTSVFDVASDIYQKRFAFSPPTYNRLLRWKLWYVRGYHQDEGIPGKIDAFEMFDHVQALVDFALTEAVNVQPDERT